MSVAVDQAGRDQTASAVDDFSIRKQVAGQPGFRAGVNDAAIARSYRACGD